MALTLSVASNRFGREELWDGPCPAAFDLQDWVELPAIIDGIASPDTQLAFDSSLRAEVIARRHPEWLEIDRRLDLSPARQMQVERIAAAACID